MSVVKMRASMAFDPATCEKVDGLPVAFRIWKFGVNPTDKDGKVIDVNFTARACAILLQEQATRGNRYSFDIDHLSQSAVAPPEARRGMGSHILEARGTTEEPELWAADCRWTEFAAAGMRQEVPEWISFSPAFDISKATLEPVSYLNTSLTNNPATHHATVFANRGLDAPAPSGAQEQRMEFSAFLAALQELIAKAQTPVAAAAPPASAEPAKAEPVKATEPPPPAAKEPDGDEGKKTEAVTASLSRLHTVESELLAYKEAELKAKKEKADAEERTRLLASRKDFGPAVLKGLENASLDVVRWSVENLPKSANLAAVVSVQATRGVGQTSEADSALPADEAAELKVQMGLVETVRACKKVGNTMVFGVRVPRATEAK